MGVGFRRFRQASGDWVSVNVILANREVFSAADFVVGEASLPDGEF